MTIAEELFKKGQKQVTVALSSLIKKMKVKFNNKAETFEYFEEFIAIFDYNDLDKYEKALDKAETLEEFKRMI